MITTTQMKMLNRWHIVGMMQDMYGVVYILPQKAFGGEFIHVIFYAENLNFTTYSSNEFFDTWSLISTNLDRKFIARIYGKIHVFCINKFSPNAFWCKIYTTP